MSLSSSAAKKMAGVYEKLEVLGSGSFGKAWLVNCPTTDRKAVLKEIKLDSLSEKEVGQTMVEVKVLAKCRHVNIVSYCEAFLSSGCLNIVMEYADGGDLQKKILDQNGIHFDYEVVMDFFIQICFALKYLHSENILHRDLKPQNLFLTSEGIVKVGDFGIARIMEDTADHALTAVGTPYYLSPEICQRLPYKHKSDMWSAGCVLYELCCLAVPFQAPNLPLLVLKILGGCYHPIPGQFGAVLEDLVAVLLKTDPTQRPSAQQVLSVPALQRQVKLTYRRCVAHRQRRHRHTTMATEGTGSPQRAKTDDTFSRQTYTVRSPLLRQLSAATPDAKVKAGAKRPGCTQSAVAVPSVKRQRKTSSPPVLNLREAMLKLRPSSFRHPSAPERPDSPSSADDFVHNSIGDDDPADDVFEDGIPTTNDQLPDTGSTRNDDDSQDELDNSPGISSEEEDEVSEEDTKREDVGVQCELQITVNSQSRLLRDEEKTRDSKPSLLQRPLLRDEEKTRDSEPSLLQRPLLRDEEKTRDCEPSLLQKPLLRDEEKTRDSKPSLLQRPLLRDEEKTRDGKRSLLQNPLSREKEKTRNSKPSSLPRPCPSNTYTVLRRAAVPRQETYCPVCNTKPQSLQCMNKALYGAAAFSCRRKPSAQRCLSRFLIAHLGSELSLHLCALVNSALQAGKEYSSLEESLDESCKIYLPAICQLLILSNDSVLTE